MHLHFAVVPLYELPSGSSQLMDLHSAVHARGQFIEHDVAPLQGPGSQPLTEHIDPPGLRVGSSPSAIFANCPAGVVEIVYANINTAASAIMATTPRINKLSAIYSPVCYFG